MENIDWLHVALIVLVIAGAWALVELALMLRRTSGVVGKLGTSVDELNATLAETRPIINKLDGAVEELQPAMAQMEPILKNVNTTVEALNANLVEIEGVVRDVSSVSGAAANAGNAVSSITDTAASKVNKFLGKRAAEPTAPAHTLEGPAAETADAEAPEAPTSPKSYYTYKDGDSNE